MKKVIIVINGRGGCGKDTLCDIAAKYYPVKNVSSITPIKELATQAGWKGEKDAKSRKMLADLKQLFTEYNDLCNNYILSEADSFLESDDNIMFVHIREGAEIAKFVSSAKDKCLCKTLLISRKTDNYSNEALGNSADDCVNDFSYDWTYENKADNLETLEKDFMTFFKGAVESL